MAETAAAALPTPVAAPAPCDVELTLAEQTRVVDQLEESLRAAGRAEPVQRFETHISFVLVAGAWAYKIKKAVNLGFLDFTTLARRRHFCVEELRLNRRFAPALYVDGVAVTRGSAGPEFGGSGEVIEHAIRMRAFPQEALWSRLVAAGALRTDAVDRLAQRLWEIHRDAPVCAAGAAHGRPEQVRAPVLQTLDALGSLLRDAAECAALRRLRDWETQAFERLRARFEARHADGHVRDCHGDLHLANVAQIDGVSTPFDGLEFDPELRWTDVMSDVAFLAMDLQRHGRADLAHRFVNAYLEHGGDYAGAAVLRYHVVYRALVRAKIAALGNDRGGSSYLDVALACSAPIEPMLLITHGLSGSGKTSGTTALLEVLGAIRIRADVERKRLAGLGALATTASALDQGLYAPERTLATHARLRDAAACALQGGYDVILDATFVQRDAREAARELARTLGVRFAILDFRAPAATLRARVRARERTAADASEAGLAVLEAQLAQAQPLGADERHESIDIDAERPFDANAVAAHVAGLRRRPSNPE